MSDENDLTVDSFLGALRDLADLPDPVVVKPTRMELNPCECPDCTKFKDLARENELRREDETLP